jgi:hypothetical protein
MSTNGVVYSQQDYIKDVIIVKYKSNINLDKILELDKKFKTKSEVLIEELNIYKIKLPKNMKVEEAIKIYNQSGFVEYAEPDYIMKIQNKKKKELKIYYDIGLC